MVPQKKVCDEENGKKQVADSYFFVKRIGVRGARCGIDLFVVRVLRGMVYGRCVAPRFPCISWFPVRCLHVLSGIPIRIRQDAIAVDFW